MKTRRLAIAVSLAFLLAPAARAASVKEVHETVPLDADGTLTIKTFKGSITVTGDSGAEARIDARIEADGDWSDQARKVEETRVDIGGRGSSVTVKSDYEGVKRRGGLFFWKDDGRLPFVHYKITIPKTAHLVIDDYKSEISVAGAGSSLKLETYKGRVRLRDLEGPAKLTTYKGEMNVDVARLAGDLRLSTYKGTYDVTLPKESRFTLDADTGRRGAFESDFPVTSHLAGRVGHRSGHVRGEANGGGPRVELDTYKGSLRLRAK
jgi:hypothetical protein